MKRSEAESAAVAAVATPKPMTRNDVTDLIYSAKVQKGITWSSVAKKVGQSKEWVTAACLGQMTLTKEQAEKVGKIFGLPAGGGEAACKPCRTRARCRPRCRPTR